MSIAERASASAPSSHPQRHLLRELTVAELTVAADDGLLNHTDTIAGVAPAYGRDARIWWVDEPTEHQWVGHNQVYSPGNMAAWDEMWCQGPFTAEAAVAGDLEVLDPTLELPGTFAELEARLEAATRRIGLRTREVFDDVVVAPAYGARAFVFEVRPGCRIRFVADAAGHHTVRRSVRTRCATPAM